MSVPETPAPAAELRSAAAKLRGLIEGAAPGPWWPDASIPYGHRVGNSDVDAGWVARTGEFGETGSGSNAGYIAAMHPGVGQTLADWLEREAAGHQAVDNMAALTGELLNVELATEGHRTTITHSTLPQALAVARQILGGAS